MSPERFGLVPGTLFSVPSIPRDRRVPGEGPYLPLHLAGAEHYAR